jgi:hypothetical protein
MDMQCVLLRMFPANTRSRFDLGAIIGTSIIEVKYMNLPDQTGRSRGQHYLIASRSWSVRASGCDGVMRAAAGMCQSC